jgi:hypothetical protein
MSASESSARSYGARSYGARSYGARSYGARSYGARSYGARSYGARFYRLGVDVGGTFTDVLLVEEASGATWRAKTAGCTVAAWPGSTSVVESISVTIAGPPTTSPARSRARSWTRASTRPPATCTGCVSTSARDRVADALGQGHGRDGRLGSGHRGARVDHLVVDRQQEREQPLVLGVEPRGELREGRVRIGHRDRDLEALAVVADVDLVTHRLVGAVEALPGQPCAGLLGQLAEDPAELARAQIREPGQHGAGGLVAQARRRVAVRREHSGRRRHDHRPDARQPAQGGRVQRAGAAEGDEREVARVVSPAAPTPGAGRRACSR